MGRPGRVRGGGARDGEAERKPGQVHLAATRTRAARVREKDATVPVGQRDCGVKRMQISVDDGSSRAACRVGISSPAAPDRSEFQIVSSATDNETERSGAAIVPA